MGEFVLRTTTAAVVSALALEPRRDDWPRLGDIPEIPGPLDLTLLVSPDNTWPDFRAFFQGAQQTLDLYIYNLSGRHIVDEIRGAALRGARVRLMVDATDTRGSEGDILNELRAELGERIEIRKAPSVRPRGAFTVCHQKFAVADGRNVVLGSANWAKTSIPPITDLSGPWPSGNREWLTIVHNSVETAAFFSDLFELDWNYQPAGVGIQGEEEPQPVSIAAMRALAIRPPRRRFDPKRVQLPVGSAITPLISPQNYLSVISALLEGAKREVVVQQQYVSIEGEDAHVHKLLRILSRRRRDLDIRIMIAATYPEAVEKTRRALSSHGLLDCLRFLNPGSFTHCHNKGLVVDAEKVVVSSTNWSDNSIGAAREAGLLIADSTAAGHYLSVFDEDWAQSISLDRVGSQALAVLAAGPAVGILADDDGADDL